MGCQGDTADGHHSSAGVTHEDCQCHSHGVTDMRMHRHDTISDSIERKYQCVCTVMCDRWVRSNVSSRSVLRGLSSHTHGVAGSGTDIDTDSDIVTGADLVQWLAISDNDVRR